MVPQFRGTGPLALPSTAKVIRVAVPTRGYFAHAVYELRKALAFMRFRFAARNERGSLTLLSRISPIGVAAIVAHLLGFRVYLEVNGLPDDESEARGIRGMRLLIIRQLVSLQLRLCDGAVCVTDGLKAEALARGVARACRIENGVDLNDIPVELMRHEGDPNLIVYSGALAPWQEVDALLHALSFLRQSDLTAGWRLLIVGDGEQRAALEGLAARLNVHGAVEWRGWVSRQDSLAQVARGKVAVVPLRPKSPSGVCGSPLKLFEYLALRRAVVASNVDGVTELVNYPILSIPSVIMKDSPAQSYGPHQRPT